MTNNKVVQYAEAIIRWRWLVIFSTIAITAGLAYGMSKAYFKTDYRVFFSGENPQMLAFENIQATYDKADNVLFVITPKDGNVFSPKTLSTVQWLTEAAKAAPNGLRVDSITNFQHTWAEGEDDLFVKDLICYPMAVRDGFYDTECSHRDISLKDIESYTEQDRLKLSNIVANDPVLKGRLISDDRDVTAVNLTVDLPEEAQTEVLKIAAFVRDLAKQAMERDPNVEIRLTGMVMMNVSFPEATFRDTETLLPLMLLVVIIMLWFLLRTVSGMIAAVLLLAFSVLGAMGIFIWMGGFLTGPVMSAPIIILTMAVADSVHLLVTFLQQMRRGDTKHQAMVESMRINMQPVFLTSLTTIIGFMSMNFSDVPPLGDLGTVVSIGVFLAFIHSVAFLPAFIMIMPIKGRSEEHKAYHALNNLAEWVIAKRKILLPSTMAFSILLIAFIPNNELNDEFVKYFDEDIQFRADTDYTEANLTGLYNIFVSVESGEEHGINSPDFLNAIKDFSDYAMRQSEVVHVDTLSNTMRRLNRSMHADQDVWYRLPESKELAAQYLLMYEMSLPAGLSLNNQIDVKKSSVRLNVTLQSLSSNEIIALEQQFDKWFLDNAPDFKIRQASPNLMFAHIGERNIKSSLSGTAIALILISIALMFTLRSFKMGALSLIPNLIPAGIAFGLWGMFAGQVGMSLAVVAGMSLGIVVDDTVHFLSKYLRARREKNMNSQDAVRYAFSTVGMALTATTIILVVGFYIMTWSLFTMNSDMGLMTALVIAIALIVDFLLLPPLLMKLEENSDEKTDTSAELAGSSAT